MTTHTKNCFAVIVVLTIGLPAALAGEPNDSSIDLTFEVQSQALGPFSVSAAYRSGGPAVQAFASQKPAYAAGIPLEGPRQYLVFPGTQRGTDFVRRALRYEGLSTIQEEFLRATKGLFDSDHLGSGPVPQRYRPEHDPNAPQRLLLYAMTAEDAKAMAEAYVERVMDGWRHDVGRTEEAIEKMKREHGAAKERLPEVDRAIQSTKQALGALKQKVPYRTEKEAMEAIAELDRMINAAQVDIAGSQAKLRAIQEHQRTGRLPFDIEPIEVKLQVMFVEESVALQGAEARSKMATQLRADANRFLDLTQSLVKDREERAALADRVDRYPGFVADLQHRLKEEKAERPRVADETIPIYPVRWGDSGRGD